MLKILIFNLMYNFKKIIEHIYLYVFFTFSIALFGLLSVRNEKPELNAIVWVLILFTLTLAMQQFWNEDEQDGTIDQWRVSGKGLEWVALMKWITHMLLIVLPVAAIAGWGMKLLGFPIQNSAHIAMVTAIGGAQMMATGMLAAAATVGLQRTSGIIGIVMLPLAVPSMVWGSAAMGDANNSSALVLLCAYALLSVPLSCIGSAAMLRSSN